MPDLANALTTRMNFLSARQAVIAGNIANVSTPGYVAKDMVFQPAVTAALGEMTMRRTQVRHMGGAPQGGSAGKMVENSRFMQANGNAVRLDMEMLNMQQTQMDYRMMTQIYAKQVAMQKMAMGLK